MGGTMVLQGAGRGGRDGRRYNGGTGVQGGWRDGTMVLWCQSVSGGTPVPWQD